VHLQQKQNNADVNQSINQSKKSINSPNPRFSQETAKNQHKQVHKEGTRRSYNATEALPAARNRCPLLVARSSFDTKIGILES